MDFKLPDIGEGVHEGELVKWLVKEGDQVKVDQPIVEVMTDKATVEIPTSVAGTVGKLMAKEGEIVKVGQTLMVIQESGAKGATTSTTPTTSQAQTRPQVTTPSASQAATSPVMQTSATARANVSQQQASAVSSPVSSPVSSSVSSPVSSPGNVLATPATRRLARDLNIDLTQISATGPNGRVTKEDVQNFAGATAAGPQLPVQRMSGTISAPATTRPQQTTKAPSPLIQGQRETLIPFRGIRKKISEAMTKSRFTIADFTYVDECDISELVQFRNDAKETAAKDGVKLTYMPFIVKAIVRALKEYPYMNSELDEAGGNIILKNYYNIGIAVDTEQGLIVPVVKNADQKGILDIAREIQHLSEKARSGKLTLEDLKGSSFSITNSGNIGGIMATPVINYPEAAIFGVHKISRKPIVKKINGKDEIVVADVIYLSVAVDHRIVDGAMAARFMNVVIEYLSNPKKLLL